MQDPVPAACFESGPFVVRPATRQLLSNGNPVELEAKVLDLIVLLIRNHDRALGKQEIIEALWGRRPITDAALSQLIYKARRACGDDGERQAVIRTIYGRGLQWVMPVQVMVADPTPAVRTTRMLAPAASELVERARVAPRMHPQPRLRLRRWLPAAAVILMTCAALGWWLMPRGPATAAPTAPRIAILPIENATGQAGLAWTERGLPGLIASLLTEPRGLDVVDPMEIAKAWELAPPKGRSRAEHVRFVTGATTTVGGRLRKLADKLYELTLHVDLGNGRPTRELVLTGVDPGSLGAPAALRIGRAVGEAPTYIPAAHEMPRDGYLMETFARGLEPALRQDWRAALPHFTLVARGEPRFLPARFRLGQAQARTDQQDAARKTLQGVADEAVQNARPDLAARSLAELAQLATLRHAYADALDLLDGGRRLAAESDSPQVRAELAIATARARSRLGRPDLAERDLAEARRLIEGHDLRRLQPALHNVEIFIADGRGDYAALEAAARAGLASNEAIGDERGSMAALFNIGYGLENQGRSTAALTLWARAWQWARAHQDYQMLSLAGYYIASTLQDHDLDKRGDAIAQALLEQARHARDANTQRLMLQMQSGSLWRRGDEAGALQSGREASSLADPRNDPQGALATWITEAFVALSADPASVANIVQRADALAANPESPQAFGFQRQLLHALRAAAASDAAGIQDALTAADHLATSGNERIDLRQVALRIALATGDDAAAEFALAGFDVASSSSTTELRLVEQWARGHDRSELVQKATSRRQALRQSALNAIRDTPLPTAATSIGS